jgi:hypothetical protein
MIKKTRTIGHSIFLFFTLSIIRNEIKENKRLREGLDENGLTQIMLYKKKLFCFKEIELLNYYLAKGREIHNYCYQCDPQLVCEGNNRLALIVEDKAKVLEMEAIFEKFERHTDLVVYGVHDRGDMEYDKNYFWWSRCVDRDTK